MMRPRIMVLTCISLPGLIPAAWCAAPTVPSSASIEGDWVRTDTHGSQAFGGLADSFSKAVLTAEGEKAASSFHFTQLPPVAAPHKAGEAYKVVDEPCKIPPSLDGSLGVNPDSGGIHIIVSKDQVLVAPERWGPRIIYLDGRAHPDPSHLVASGGGHGVGHFENNVLIVDTVGLNTGPVTAGGWKTAETHLGERFQVAPDGKHMTIQYTWTDPKLYLKPHTYAYTFDRLPAPSYALEDWCDAGDHREAESVTPPEQN